ncbi:MAG: hypothetical protein BMS9Abin10_0943 [Gammaproteobacteria bacterium]|nr:MAG: hypothetical protein BMS9Abin10_0943 [Gammaproteobacteria bacterium]
MGRIKITLRAATVLMAALFLAACAGKTTVKSNLHIKGAPDWVNKGTNALNDKKGRLFHGVGIAPDIGDISLQKDTADNRARAEVARILSSYMEVVSKDYSTASNVDGQQINEQEVSREINNVTNTNLSGTKIIGRWRDKKSSTIYSLAELDMRYVKQTVKTFRDMNDGLRKYIGQNADVSFDKFSEESR